MDSISQAALGAAVTLVAMGRRTAAWKAVLIGAAAGTLPDLDALIDFGDPVANMTYHRGDSHALLWLALLGPVLGAAVARLPGEAAHRRRWMLALSLALLTHPLLDLMTVYGTQLLRPFSGEPLGVGSLFIIDPLYTLPLLVGVAGGLAGRLRCNQVGLALSCVYIAWSVAAQAWVRSQAEQSLRQQGVKATQLLVTPTPFNTVLWNVIAITDDHHYLQGQRGLLDAPGPMRFQRFARGSEWMPQLAQHWHVQRVAWFSRGFWKLEREADGRFVVTDLRMGISPYHVFAFRVHATASERGSQPSPQAVGSRGDVRVVMAWLQRRLRGELLPPPS